MVTVLTPIHIHLVLMWHDGSCLIPCEGHWCLEMSKRRKSEDEEWSSEKQDVGEGKGDHVQLFSGQALNSRKRTDAFTSERESTWASFLPLAPLPSRPLVCIYPVLLAFISLLLSSSILPCYLLSVFLSTVVSLHPFLLFSPSSFTFPSYPQSSRLSIGPLRSLSCKYFPGIEIEQRCQF